MGEQLPWSLVVLRWFDRLRRVLAILIACAVTPFAIAWFAASVGLDWVSIEILLGVMLASVLWIAIEVVFAIVVAVAETPRAATRAVGLPQARLLSKRWFGLLVHRPRERPRPSSTPGAP